MDLKMNYSIYFISETLLLFKQSFQWHEVSIQVILGTEVNYCSVCQNLTILKDHLPYFYIIERNT